MKAIARLEKRREVWFVLAICVLFFLLRLPSLIEPYWYGDEGIYQVIGKGLDSGRMLYTQVWDNKPPLLYLIYALFGPDQFWIRLMSLFFGLASVVAFFFLSLRVLNSMSASFLATGIFAFFFATPMIEGNIANAENFMLLPIILGGILTWNAAKQHSIGHIMLGSGLFLGIAFLFKIVGLFDFLAFLTFLKFVAIRKHSEHSLFTKPTTLLLIRFVTPLVIGFLIPIAVTFLYFLINGNYSHFLQAAFFNNIGYVGYGNQFIIPQGLLLFKIILLGISLGVLFSLRKRLNLAHLFILIWVVFSLFNAFFSQRPYTHYVLVTLPAMSLLTGLLFTVEKRQRKFFLIVFACSLLLIYQNFSIHSLRKTILYYENFLSFITQEKSLEEYQAFFDSNTPRDYQIASFLKTRMTAQDELFMWGNSAQIYMLSDRLPPGRFSVAYHIVTNQSTIAETQADLERVNPKYIVILPDLQYYPFSLSGYVPINRIQNAYIYERIY